MIDTFKSGHLYSQPTHANIRLWFGSEEINIPRNNLISFNCKMVQSSMVGWEMTLFDIDYVYLENKWDSVRGKGKIAFQIYWADDNGVIEISPKWQSQTLTKWQPTFSNDGVSIQIGGTSASIVPEAINHKMSTLGSLQKQITNIIHNGIKNKIWILHPKSDIGKVAQLRNKISKNNGDGVELSYKTTITNDGYLGIINKLLAQGVTKDGEILTAYLESRGSAIPYLQIKTNEPTDIVRTYTYFHGQKEKTDVIEWSPTIPDIVSCIINGQGSDNQADISADENTSQDNVYKTMTEEAFKNRIDKVFNPKMEGFDNKMKTFEDVVRGKEGPVSKLQTDNVYNNNISNFIQKFNLSVEANLTIWGDFNIYLLEAIYVKCIMTKKNPDGTVSSLGEHYSSGKYQIIEIQHNIDMGTFTTELKLVKIESISVEHNDIKRVINKDKLKEIKKIKK